ncbi:hypothetical protein [Marinigracilibium pacificum]|uniref:Uncharacterized protein n=1 Tax=Marinigracilibium pacificum TaxID=2729599 RepID=A0A848J030_9BACT|nr:hypothetical protein [Marinigracilibium pacificum]NMM49206.1 hypothetical protein [Marinigracilibium pacificum]
MKKGFLGVLIAIVLILIVDQGLKMERFYPEFGTYSGEFCLINGEEKAASEKCMISFNAGKYSIKIDDQLIANGKYRLVNDRLRLIDLSEEVTEFSHVFNGSFKTIETGTFFVLERSLDEIVYRLTLEKKINEKI